MNILLSTSGTISTKQCPSCFGRGYRPRYRKSGGPGFRAVDCARCDGSGGVPEVTRCTIKLSGGEVFAVLWDVPANPGMRRIYAHVGQHGEACCAYICEAERLDHESEMARPLVTELRGIGYNLRMVKRQPRAKR